MVWDKKHLLEIDSFSRGDIENLLGLAARLEPYSGINKKERRKKINICQGDVMTVWFEPKAENSTRTFGSFPSAISRLGGRHKVFDETTSSMTKGESVEDTTRILSGQSDVIVDRHRDPEHVFKVARHSVCAVINAGNGARQHPTQTLYDMYTISKIREIDNLRIAFVGDLKYGRTVHSFPIALSKFSGVKMFGVCPKGLEMPQEFCLNGYNEHVIDMDGLDDILEEIQPDIIYATRIQEERLTENSEKYRYIINHKTLEKTDAHVLHPLPRKGEIDPLIDNEPRALYFKQADNSIPVRMAIIASLLGYEDEIE